MGCSGLSVVNPSIMATRQSFLVCRDEYRYQSRAFQSQCHRELQRIGAAKGLGSSVVNEELTGSAEVFVA
jgi:hypothetical protein